MPEFSELSASSQERVRRATGAALEKAYGTVYETTYEETSESMGVWTIRGQVVVGDCGGEHGVEPPLPVGESVEPRKCHFPFTAVLDAGGGTIEIDRMRHDVGWPLFFGGGGGRSGRSSNDDRSDSFNPNNQASRAAANNRSNQMNRNNPAYPQSRGRRR
jgi:hypothetical protein